MIDLILGDCLEVMKDIPDGSVDAIITDPPYGTTICKWDSVIPFEPMWEQLNRVIKPNGAIVLFGSEPFSSLLRCSNIKDFKYDWVWQKQKPSNFMNANRQPMKYHEIISVFYKKQPTYNKQMIPRDEGGKSRIKYKQSRTNSAHREKLLVKKDIKYDRDLKNPSSVLKINTTYQNTIKHPTQKPLRLMENLIKTYTNEGETVLDFTMGSGSTGVAAKNLNRNFIGIEQDQKYFNIAEQRINETEFKLF